MRVDVQPGCFICRIALDPDESVVVKNDAAIVYMSRDQRPANRGHVGVAPVQHHQSGVELPEAVVTSLAMMTRALMVAVQSAFEADGVTVHQHVGTKIGQHVDHEHWHVVPRYQDDDYWASVGAREHEFLHVPPFELLKQAGTLREVLARREHQC
ncbi:MULTISPECIES: HIT family protein [unclassified Microbacterium]|uniref:HIT family protein n=1 Tax=unclassified Microbacterium TaxID=2609290 RepID=UPI000CFBAA2F|nr:MULTISPECIES: HIT family protein [unclassified Microbacterium]PQZ73260.1 HIT family hydrolase [Microbacterium sp. MYb40]PRB24387.1 HIT family hydrolase [Microbacterium sp. MYb50]PQZ53032.1 HIT family hydrolase [Microbacterium sp. MYb43]PRB18720.1 HIT family hydrolase [Microbacterium sp. MYb54]PRB64435.1 HIT family hydrolase [Microbacterium sp. MYb32]